VPHLSRAALILGLSFALAAPVAAAKRAIIIHEASAVTGANNLRTLLQARGFDVTLTGSVPGDLSPYCCAWDLRPFIPISSSEAGRFRGFVADGHGLFVTGERAPCCSSRNDSIEDLMNTLGGGSVMIDPLDEIPFDSVHDQIAGRIVNTDPNRIRKVTYDGNGTGIFTSLGKGSALGTHSPTGKQSAAMWREANLAAKGRVVVTLDVNWLIDTYNQTDNKAYAENMTYFLCPSLDAGVEVTITQPNGFNLECPDTVTVEGIVDGTTEDCAQPTSLTIAQTGLEDPTPRIETVLAPGGARGDGDPSDLVIRQMQTGLFEAPDDALPPSGKITEIEWSRNGGPFSDVSFTNKALPADPPVEFRAENLALVFGGNTITIRAENDLGLDDADDVSGTLADRIPP